jgi:hypothetical protein
MTSAAPQLKKESSQTQGGVAEIEKNAPAESAPIESSEVHHGQLCPNCGSPRYRRSHRTTLYERFILPIVGLQPYRCKECYERFYCRRSGVAA